MLYNQFQNDFSSIRDSPSCESCIYATAYTLNYVSIWKNCMTSFVQSDTLLWLTQTETPLRKPLFSLLLDLISIWKSFSFPIQYLLESKSLLIQSLKYQVSLSLLSVSKSPSLLLHSRMTPH
jgi:hypothetical protein